MGIFLFPIVILGRPCVHIFFPTLLSMKETNIFIAMHILTRLQVRKSSFFDHEAIEDEADYPVDDLVVTLPTANISLVSTPCVVVPSASDPPPALPPRTKKRIFRKVAARKTTKFVANWTILSFFSFLAFSWTSIL